MIPDVSPFSDRAVAQQIASIRERMAAAARRSGHDLNRVVLLAVTKGFGADAIRLAVGCGVTDIGENYVQEAKAKFAETDTLTVNRHLIGHLQSNKAKLAVGLFDTIQSVGNYQLAQELNKQGARTDRVVPVLIEVNIARQENRAGVLAEACIDLCQQINETLPSLRLDGLMGIPPAGDTTDSDVRRYFRELRTLFDQLPETNRRTLSMGMSGDFEAAIEEGSTMIRIGTAIFGKRR